MTLRVIWLPIRHRIDQDTSDPLRLFQGGEMPGVGQACSYNSKP
jgi:hypothetical protein